MKITSILPSEFLDHSMQARLRKRLRKSFSFTLTLWSLVLFSLWGTLSACDEEEEPEVYESSLSMSSPLKLGKHLISFDETREQAWLINTEGNRLIPTTTPIAPPNWVHTVSQDERFIATLSPEEHTLTIIEPGKETRSFDVENAYNAVKLSDDGTLALVWYQQVNFASDELFNPNAYAIINLKNDKVTQRTLRSFGDAPIDVLFVPPIVLAGNTDPTLHALFLFNSYVTFADLNEGQYEVTAQLRLNPTAPAVIPSQVVFSDWLDEGSTDEGSEVGRFAYLTARGSNDIYALHLLEDVDTEGVVRLRPSINQLPSGLNPARLLRYRGADDREKLLVVNQGDQTLSVIDASTASVLKIPLNTPADQIYAYVAADGEEQALIYSELGQSSIVTFVRLSALEDRRGQALSQLGLESPVTEVINSPIDGQAIALHSNRRGISLIDLNQAFANPLRAQLSLNDWVLDRDQSRIYTTVSNSTKLTIIELATAQVRVVDVERQIEKLILIPETKTLVLTHLGYEGNFTVMNTDSMTYESSSFYGALYFERALP